MASRWTEFLPRKVAALRSALIALSVLLLVPACSAFASQAGGVHAGAVEAQPGSAAGHAQHHDAALSRDFCASTGTSAIAVTIGRPLAPKPGAVLALAPLAPWHGLAATIVLQPAAASQPPPTKASFYLRSTRILR